jgi:hypothetical protein
VFRWHQQEAKYPASLMPQLTGQSSEQRDSVEEMIVWASYDSLSPGEEEGFALERAQEITAVGRAPSGFQR